EFRRVLFRSHQHRGVVQRRDGEVDVAVPGCDAEQAGQVAEQLAHVGGVDLGQAALHALGATGGAGRVVHRSTGGATLGGGRGLAVGELRVGAEAVDGADGEGSAVG